jgi:dTDP-glucose pyrophosphorylase
MIDLALIAVDEHTPLKEALVTMDKAGEGFLVVCRNDRRVVGVVADGDVRRALIAGVTPGASIGDLMNRDFKFARHSESREGAIAQLKQAKYRQLPILDADGRLVDILLSDHFATPRRDNIVVVMAGGQGARLRPMTDTVPKPMLRVGDKPFLERILDTLIAQGFHRFYFCVHYLADQITDHFKDGTRWGVAIDYIHEEKQLGTAGALGLIPSPGSLPLLVMNADLVTRLDFGAMLAHHTAHAPMVTMAVRTLEMQVPFGVVETEGSYVSRIVEKPIQAFLINAGIYVVDPACLAYVPKGNPIDMTTLLDKLVQANKSIGHFPLYEAWMDIGRMEDYQRALQFYAAPDDEN